MSLKTYSKFYYGYEVDGTNFQIDFKEGSTELVADIAIGSYTLTEFCQELSTALNDAGSLSYAVTIDRSTRQITIAADGVFSLLVSSGSHLGTTGFGTAGFTGADRVSASTYTGNLVSGSVYSPQFILQSHIDPDDYENKTYGTVNKSASGEIEVVTFGTENFMQCEIKYATNINVGSGSPIRNNPTGHEDLRAFMRFLIGKSPVEFMQNEGDLNSFRSLILESTPDDSKGLKFKLREIYDKGLPGFYETGTLLFRVIQ